MKLLSDENLARELVVKLDDVFPDSRHVATISLERASDREVWDHARAHGFAIISKDSDFNHLAFLYGAPPKIIWLRVGNCTTDLIERIMRSQKAEATAFADSLDAVLILE